MSYVHPPSYGDVALHLKSLTGYDSRASCGDRKHLFAVDRHFFAQSTPLLAEVGLEFAALFVAEGKAKMEPQIAIQKQN